MRSLLEELSVCLVFVCLAQLPVIPVFSAGTGGGMLQDGKGPSTRSLKGKVVEKGTNEPLIGVNIWLKDTSVGCITDVNGNFSLSVPVGKTSVLVVSYIGYGKLEKEVAASVNDLLVELEPETTTLEAVQVVGYGTQRKESVIGSIEAIRPADLKIPAASLSTGLIGKLGGIVSVQRSGEPGASSEFWIRGISTFGANGNPLVLVDGVERSLDLVEAEEIESFSILKDATATAVYGVRGANGVILITTKRGEEGKPHVSVKAEAGVLQPTKVPKMANSVEYAQMYNELKGYDYYSADEIEKYATLYDPDLYPNVNWLKTIFKDYTYNQHVTASVSGGGSIARYFISGAFYREDGIMRTDGGYAGNPNYRRYNFRSNLDVNLSPSTVLSLTLGGVLEQRRTSAEDLDRIWFLAFKINPNAFPVRYSNGYFSGRKEQENPYYVVTRAGYNKSWKSILNSVISLRQDLSRLVTPGLEVNLKFSFDTDNYNNSKYTNQDDIYYALGRDENNNLIFGDPEIQQAQVGYSHSSSGSNATYLEASLNYDRAFGRHHVGALMLYNQRVYNTTAASAIESLPYKNQGLAGRLTYDYDSRYFIEGNFGYNGSENFARGHRLGFFPSGAVGWYVSNEPFFEPLKSVVSKLKLKASVGQVGNDKINGSRFVYLGTVANTDPYIYGDFSSWTGQRADEIPNPEASWEVSTKWNYGIELGFFDNLEIHADWYTDTREKIFIRNNGVPSFVGLSTMPWDNIGRMRSWGFDGSAEYNRQFRDLTVSARASFTYASNKILEYNNFSNVYPYMDEKGQKMYQQRGYVALGLFGSDEEIKRSPTQFSEAIHSQLRPGDIKYADINGDGMIDAFDEVPIGYSDIPEITYGFGASLNWRGMIDFSFFFQGTGRVTAFEMGETLAPFTDSNPLENGFYADVVKKHWSVENPDPHARYPRLSEVPYQDNNNYKASTFWQRDASYLRLKNMEIGYTFPKRWTERIGLSTVRLYVSGMNLWTWAKDLHLYDPELGVRTGSATDGRKYPLNRVYNFGLNINF